jgi:hypothetical protein
MPTLNSNKREYTESNCFPMLINVTEYSQGAFRQEHYFKMLLFATAPDSRINAQIAPRHMIYF